MDIGDSAGSLVAGIVIQVPGYPAGFLNGFALSFPYFMAFLSSFWYSGPSPG
jgi:hypothetical protein